MLLETVTEAHHLGMLSISKYIKRRQVQTVSRHTFREYRRSKVYFFGHKFIQHISLEELDFLSFHILVNLRVTRSPWDDI